MTQLCGVMHCQCILSSLQLFTNNGMCFDEDTVFRDPPGYLGDV